MPFRQPAVEPPKDQKEILDMLVQPQTFGQGLFDYSCHGNNWNVAESVVSVLFKKAMEEPSPNQ